LKKIIEQVLVDVNNGQFLADSLARYDGVFGDFFVNIVRVGESSGTLTQNLLYLAEELKKSKELESKVRSAMIYPVIILIATVCLTAFLAFGIFPKLMPIFTSLRVELPWSTQILISTLNWVKTNGIYALIVAIVSFIGLRILISRSDSIRYLYNRILMKIPVLGGLIVNIQVANFTRVLGVLLRGGMKIVQAIDVTANTFDNIVYRRALRDANEEIKKGSQLALYLTSHPDIFPPLISGMVRIGENTGNLEENLFYLADFYNEEIESTLHDVTSLLEPLMLLIMGLIVAFVAISIITPIYSISQNIK
jgi:type II secretory pathway component PulF